jgi:hypothetical protein
MNYTQLNKFICGLKNLDNCTQVKYNLLWELNQEILFGHSEQFANFVVVESTQNNAEDSELQLRTFFADRELKQHQ